MICQPYVGKTDSIESGSDLQGLYKQSLMDGSEPALALVGSCLVVARSFGAGKRGRR